MGKQFISQNIERNSSKLLNFYRTCTVTNKLSSQTTSSVSIYPRLLTEQGEVQFPEYYSGNLVVPANGSKTGTGNHSQVELKAKNITGLVLEFDTISTSVTASNATVIIQLADQITSNPQVVTATTTVATDKHVTTEITFNKPYDITESSLWTTLSFSITLNR